VKRIRIIGVGSPTGDDQVGWRVIDALRQGQKSQGQKSQLAARNDSYEIELVTLDRPGTQLIQYLQDTDMAILIDAIKCRNAPGTIHRFDDISQLDPDDLVSSHGLGVATALQLMRALNQLPPKLVLFGIEIDTAYCGITLSTAVSQAEHRMEAMIDAELADMGKTDDLERQIANSNSCR